MENNMDMEYPMFCYQCEQTAGGKGCTKMGSVERHQKLQHFKICLYIK